MLLSNLYNHIPGQSKSAGNFNGFNNSTGNRASTMGTIPPKCPVHWMPDHITAPAAAVPFATSTIPFGRILSSPDKAATTGVAKNSPKSPIFVEDSIESIIRISISNESMLSRVILKELPRTAVYLLVIPFSYSFFLRHSNDSHSYKYLRLNI